MVDADDELQIYQLLLPLLSAVDRFPWPFSSLFTDSRPDSLFVSFVHVSLASLQDFQFPFVGLRKPKQ